MPRMPGKKTALFDLGLVAFLIALFAVLVNKHALSPPVYMTLLVGLMLTATVIGWWREARKERQLDEVELAAASFGARWSMAAVGAIVLLLLFVPPLHDAIVWFAQAYEANEDRPLPAPVGVFVFGFVLAMFVQLAAKSALGAAWIWTKR